MMMMNAGSGFRSARGAHAYSMYLCVYGLGIVIVMTVVLEMHVYKEGFVLDVLYSFTL